MVDARVTTPKIPVAEPDGETLTGVNRVGGVVLVALALLWPSRPAFAACLAPPEPGSSGFDERVRSMGPREIIAVGTILDRVPDDAHAAWSIFLRVERYLHGSGARRIEITSYSDGDLAVGSDEPGASVDGSRAFLDEFAGERAIFFASPESARYDPGYRTSSCTYNRIGAGVDEMVEHVEAALSLPVSGVSSAPAVALLPLVAAGVLLLRRVRPAH